MNYLLGMQLKKKKTGVSPNSAGIGYPCSQKEMRAKTSAFTLVKSHLREAHEAYKCWSNWWLDTMNFLLFQKWHARVRGRASGSRPMLSSELHTNLQKQCGFQFCSFNYFFLLVAAQCKFPNSILFQVKRQISMIKCLLY